jgi:HlyD family secretion protein
MMFLVFVLSILPGCGKNSVEYRFAAASLGDLEETVTATGTVNPVTTVLVGTQVSGTIKSLFVDFNSPVKKGQVIAQIDPETFEAQVAQARANVMRAEAQMRDAERTLTRSRQLAERNLIAKSELDTAETNFAGNAASLEQTKAALRAAETNLRYTKIISPVDGIVISRNVDVGQTVAASFQTPTLFTIAQDLTRMQINTSVDEADIGKVKKGLDVEFTVDAYPDEPFEGSVEQVRNAPTTVQNVVTYDVVVKVNNPGMKLKPGMTANVSIVTARKTGVLLVPNSALRFRPGDQAKGGPQQKGQAVWVLESGKPRRVPVVTGISNGSLIELVSGELKEGQQVIVEAVKKKPEAAQRPPRMF